QAVAAEAGEIHQVDVLHVGSLAQMRDQRAEGGGLEVAPLLLGQIGHGKASVAATPGTGPVREPYCLTTCISGMALISSSIGASRAAHDAASAAEAIRSCRISISAWAKPLTMACRNMVSPRSAPS